MDVRDVGPTLAESLNDIRLQEPSHGFCSGSDELPGLPAGFPACLRGESVWNGAQDNKTRYVHVLTEGHLAEIRRALAQFKGILVADQLFQHA